MFECMLIYAAVVEALWKHLLPVFVVNAEKDFLWCRIYERLLCGVPERSMEATLEPFLLQLPW